MCGKKHTGVLTSLSCVFVPTEVVTSFRRTMTSIACVSSSVRAACRHTSARFPVSRGLIRCGLAGRCSEGESASRTWVARQVRTFHGTQGGAAPVPALVSGDDQTTFQSGLPPDKAARPAPHLSPEPPFTKLKGSAAAPVNIQSLFEGDVIPELCSRLADFPSNGRAEGLATLLGACVEFGLGTNSPLVRTLINESLQLLRNRDIGVAQLCHIGEVAYALEGRPSAVMAEVLNSMGVALEEDFLSPGETVRVYSLLALCYDPASQQQKLMLSTLNRHTQRLVHRLKAGQVSNILQQLLKFQHRQVGRAATPQLRELTEVPITLQAKMSQNH